MVPETQGELDGSESGEVPNYKRNDLIDLINELRGTESITAFAKKAGISKGHLSKIINGKEISKKSQRDFLIKLYAANLDSSVSLNDLFLAAGYKQIPNEVSDILIKEYQIPSCLKPVRNSDALTVHLDYLTQNGKDYFNIEYIDGDFIIEFPDKTKQYGFSALAKKSIDLPTVIQKVTERIKKRIQSGIIPTDAQPNSFYLISNSPSVAEMLDTKLLSPTINVIYTEDASTVTKIYSSIDP